MPPGREAAALHRRGRALELLQWVLAMALLVGLAYPGRPWG